jgi:SAM-dependent methyltransferase
MAASELNGDDRLSPRDRLRYLWRNACRNFWARGRAKSQSFLARGISPDDIRERSPSRFLTALFIRRRLIQLFPPHPINIVEIGCGSGSMMQRLFDLGYTGTYIGIDIDDRFERDHGTDFKAAFLQADAHQFQPPHPVDLLFSFSALEHIDRDDELIARLSGFMKPGGVQVHIVPAAAGLFIYLWHGYRQYRPADLVKRFGDEAEIYRLGGVGSFLVHLVAITVPEILLRLPIRKTFPDAYARLVLAGFAIDRVLPVFPSAFVVFKQH